jgi:glycosyltransferase involved in cell wall biosynthesis
MAEQPSSTPASCGDSGQAHGAPRSVLIVTPAWSRAGGIATHVAASAAALAAAGFSVEVLVRDLIAPTDLPGVTVRRAERLLDIGTPAGERLGDAATLAPDLVHFHEIEDRDLISAFQPKAPVIVSVHGYSGCSSGVYYFRPGHECSRGHGPGCVPNLLLKGCAHAFDPRPLPNAYRQTSASVAALRAADLTISYSSAVDRHLQANGIGPRRVVPLFTTVEPVVAGGHETRRRVMFAGRIVPAKGLATLIEAMRELDAELVVCGEGWQLPAMRRLADRHGVAGRVHFRGWLDPGQLARELAEASVLALPSLWPEPFGLVGIEALAAGRPVVASATGGVEDWLQDGISGLLHPPGDEKALAAKLRELLGDPARQARMGEAGRLSVAERFTPERHLSGLLEAYEEARIVWRASRGGAVALAA